MPSSRRSSLRRILNIIMSGFYSVLDEIYRNEPYYFILAKRQLPYLNTHKLINLNWFSIYQLLLLYSTQIYNAFFLTLLLWNVLLRTPKFKSTKSCKIKFFSYTNNTGSITQVNEEFYSYFGYLWISHLINQRDLRENIWDNCLRFAQQLLSWLKMNVLNKALLQLSFSLYFVPCAFGCCF